jgi:hypothetical protein
LRLHTEAFTIPDAAKAQTYDNIKQNPAEALEKYLHNDFDKVFYYLITEAHTKIQRKAIGLYSTALKVLHSSAKTIDSTPLISSIYSGKRAANYTHRVHFESIP